MDHPIGSRFPVTRHEAALPLDCKARAGRGELGRADKLLILELERDYLPKLQKIPCWNELNPRQQGALLSFAYNLGADFYGHPQFTKITAMLRDRDWSNAKSIFLLYRNPGTRVERGLKLRRLTEAYLFLYK